MVCSIVSAALFVFDKSIKHHRNDGTAIRIYYYNSIDFLLQYGIM